MVDTTVITVKVANNSWLAFNLIVFIVVLFVVHIGFDRRGRKGYSSQCSASDIVPSGENMIPKSCIWFSTY